MNARHRDRGFGDIGCQHDAPPRAALKNLALLFPGKARVQLQYVHARLEFALQEFADVADLALARQEHQDVAAADGLGLGGNLPTGIQDQRRQVGVLGVVGCFAVAYFDGMAATAHRDDGRAAKEARDAFDVQGRGGHDDFEIRAPRQ